MRSRAPVDPGDTADAFRALDWHRSASRLPVNRAGAKRRDSLAAAAREAAE